MPIRTRTTRVTVKESEIDAAFRTSRGDVNKNMRWAMFGHVTLAQKFAPKRTGNLQRNIGWGGTGITPRGMYECQYTINSYAPYSEYTLRPTGPVIFPNKSVFLWVRPKPYSYYLNYTPRMMVKGYYSEDWLEASTRALFKVLRLN